MSGPLPTPPAPRSNVVKWVNAKGEPVEVRCRFCKGRITTLREAAGKISRCETDGVLSRRDVELVDDPNRYSSGLNGPTSSGPRRRMTT